MPYKTNEDLPAAIRENLPQGAQTIYRKRYNAVFDEYGSDDDGKLARMAWAAVEEKYRQEDDGTWVLKAASAVSSIFISEGEVGISHWIPVARVGQETHLIGSEPDDEDAVFYLSKEALENSVPSWKGGQLTKNHEELIAANQILDAKFEYPLLFLKVTPEAEEILLSDNVSGRSVETELLEIEGKLAMTIAGTGLSVLYPPKVPACTEEMGCTRKVAANSALNEATAAKSEEIVFDRARINNVGARIKVEEVYLYLSPEELLNEDTVKERLATNYYSPEKNIGVPLFIYEHNAELQIGDEIPADVEPIHTVVITVSDSANSNENGIEVICSTTETGGGFEQMGTEGEGTPPVATFTKEQVDRLVASAVERETKTLKDQHEADLKAKEKELEDLKTEIKTKIETAVTDAEARAALLAKIKQSTNPTDEVFTKLSGLPIDALEVMSQLEYNPGGQAPAGISSGTEVTPRGEPEKVEEVGSWDAYKKEWVPSYREVD